MSPDILSVIFIQDFIFADLISMYYRSSLQFFGKFDMILDILKT